MYDVRVSCYVWSMSRIIFIRRNEHDFLVLGLRNNGLEVVKGGLDLLTNFPLVPCPTVCCLSDYEIGYGNGTKLRARTARKKWGRERIPNELSCLNEIFPILRIEYAYYYFIISLRIKTILFHMLLSYK